MENINLAHVPTSEIEQELNLRVGSGGVVSDAMYEIITKQFPVPCVDGIPMRVRDGKVELAAIVRNTGHFSGKLATVGGRVWRGESLGDALRRHFKTDLGAEIDFKSDSDRPFMVAQYKPLADGEEDKQFGSDKSKHSVACTYLVTVHDTSALAFGSGAAGQEASGIVWFTLEKMPPPSSWASSQDRVYRKAFEEAAVYNI